jgi:endonuclease/exonuclease/phosphatase family metal-dependent hydrolase
VVRHASIGNRRHSTVSWAVLLVLGLVAAMPLATAAASPEGSALSNVVTAKHKHRHKHRVSHFTVSTFNVLGYGHTDRGGDKASWPGGRKRMVRQVALLHKYEVDVVGFQELQPEQLHAFNRLTGRRWSVYPGKRFDRYATHNSVAWNNRHWSLVDKGYLHIPYFKGERVKMPVVKLADNKTGQRVYFANFHNPADSYGPAQKWRNKARKMEIRLARRIAKKGVPLVLTGDMNEQDRYFCAMTSKAPMKAANGGGHRHGRCSPPQPSGIDWIFGSKRIHFSDFYRRPAYKMRRITDHPFIATEARIKKR